MQSDWLLVVARSAGDGADPEGISVFLLQREMPGVSLEAVRLLDGTPAAELVLTDVVVAADALLGVEGAAYVGLQRAVDEVIVHQCAETVGGMEDVLVLCSDYLKTRKQFGVPIGSFQALQHRMADMAIETMQARASLHRALAILAAPASDDERSAAISGCKSQVMRSAKFVTAQGIQLHGGFGITEEYRVGHHYRRLVLSNAWWGGLEYHLSRYARSIQASCGRDL
ncbi:Acryloyl-CoA reductase (NADH) [compost metagenome]